MKLALLFRIDSIYHLWHLYFLFLFFIWMCWKKPKKTLIQRLWCPQQTKYFMKKKEDISSCHFRTKWFYVWVYNEVDRIKMWKKCKYFAFQNSVKKKSISKSINFRELKKTTNFYCVGLLTSSFWGNITG